MIILAIGLNIHVIFMDFVTIYQKKGPDWPQWGAECIDFSLMSEFTDVPAWCVQMRAGDLYSTWGPL